MTGATESIASYRFGFSGKCNFCISKSPRSASGEIVGHLFWVVPKWGTAINVCFPRVSPQSRPKQAPKSVAGISSKIGDPRKIQDPPQQKKGVSPKKGGLLLRCPLKTWEGSEPLGAAPGCLASSEPAFKELADLFAWAQEVGLGTRGEVSGNFNFFLGVNPLQVDQQRQCQ